MKKCEHGMPLHIDPTSELLRTEAERDLLKRQLAIAVEYLERIESNCGPITATRGHRIATEALQRIRGEK